MAVGPVSVDVLTEHAGAAGLLVALFHRRRLAALQAVVIPRGEGVYHERSHCGHHGDEAREGEVLPRLLAQTGRAEALEGVRKHVDEASGEDHARSKRLHSEEGVPLGA
uniref:Uncharacterized protein n=1 Tax=Nymphaea colorata TaxID=210225 RepID=A0A5K0WJV2_9MAGN